MGAVVLPSGCLEAVCLGMRLLEAGLVAPSIIKICPAVLKIRPCFQFCL